MLQWRRNQIVYAMILISQNREDILSLYLKKGHTHTHTSRDASISGIKRRKLNDAVVLIFGPCVQSRYSFFKKQTLKLKCSLPCEGLVELWGEYKNGVSYKKIPIKRIIYI